VAKPEVEAVGPVADLVSMGFEPSAARAALARTGGSVMQAADLLLANGGGVPQGRLRGGGGVG
jgi:hypothetical protein